MHYPGAEGLPSRPSTGSTCRCSHPSPPDSHPRHSHPAHRLRGQRQTLRTFPQERSAGPISGRDTKTHVQGQDQVLWMANVSQASRCLCVLGHRFLIRRARSWASPVASVCSSYFQGSGAPDQISENSGRVVHGHKAETPAQRGSSVCAVEAEQTCPVAPVMNDLAETVTGLTRMAFGGQIPPQKGRGMARSLAEGQLGSEALSRRGLPHPKALPKAQSRALPGGDARRAAASR